MLTAIKHVTRNIKILIAYNRLFSGYHKNLPCRSVSPERYNLFVCFRTFGFSHHFLCTSFGLKNPKTQKTDAKTLGLKVGDSLFLRDDERWHNTGLETSISRSGSIAIKFNYRIVSPIFDKNPVYLLSNSIKVTSFYCLIRKNDVFYRLIW